MIEPRHFRELAALLARQHYDDFRNGRDIAERLHNVCAELSRWFSELTAKGIDHGIVFAVLNHTKWDGNRGFMAWLDWTKVPENTRQRAIDCAAVDVRIEVTDADVIIAEDTSRATGVSELREGLSKLWMNVWQEYDFTTRGLDDAGLTTWNKLLLGYSLQPRPFGIVWDDRMPLDPCVHDLYSTVSQDQMAKCGLPSLASEQLPHPGYFLELTCPGSECPLRDLEKCIRRLEPQALLTNPARLHAVTACLVWHLLRSYSIWGGNAFLSIPVIHRTQHPGGTSVLSIGSSQPLPLAQILYWSHIGAKLLTPIAGDEMNRTLLQNLRLDMLPPEMCKQIARSRIGERTVDAILWKDRDHQPELLLTDQAMLHEFINLKTSIPGYGWVFLKTLIHGEYEVGPNLTVTDLARLASSKQAITAQVLRRLTGNISEVLTAFRACVCTAFPQWRPLGGDEVWPRNARPDCDWNEHDVKRYRLFVSAEEFEGYLCRLADIIASQVKRGNAGDRITIVCTIENGSRPILWFIVANESVLDQSGRPTINPGWTRDELELWVGRLYGVLAFYGPMKDGQFEWAPTLAYPKGRLDERSDRLDESRAVGRFKAVVGPHFAEGAVFVTGIGFQLFTHEEIRT